MCPFTLSRRRCNGQVYAHGEAVSGWDISADDQLEYNKWIADQVRIRVLSVLVTSPLSLFYTSHVLRTVNAVPVESPPCVARRRCCSLPAPP